MPPAFPAIHSPMYVTAQHTLITIGTAILAGAACCALAGCQPYRIEYHERPRFYDQASATQLPDRVVLDDGTEIVYVRPGDKRGVMKEVEKRGEKFSYREESETGDVRIRAVLPEHVLANTILCLRNEEYDLLYEQLLAEQTREYYEGLDDGYEQFEAYMRENRRDLLVTLNRMLFGIAHQDTIMRRVDQFVTRLEFRPQIVSNFAFTSVDIANERGELKLLSIR
jgi:hypothetical protein